MFLWNVPRAFKIQHKKYHLSKNVLSDLSQTGFCTYVQNHEEMKGKKEKIPPLPPNEIHDSFM